jgi:hypothetical protein
LAVTILHFLHRICIGSYSSLNRGRIGVEKERSGGSSEGNDSSIAFLEEMMMMMMIMILYVVMDSSVGAP